MERDVKIGKITKDMQIEQTVEILTALRSLGEQVLEVTVFTHSKDLERRGAVSRQAQHRAIGRVRKGNRQRGCVTRVHPYMDRMTQTRMPVVTPDHGKA